MARRSLTARVILGVVLVALVLGLREYTSQREVSGEPAARSGELTTSERGEAAIAAAFRDEHSGVWVEALARVDRMLPDDNVGSRHQRFIVRLSNGHTLLISHNIDLAQRVPISTGDMVAFRGMYEWNQRGGVVHWTHHDPDGQHAGGWIRYRGETFR